MKKEERIDGEEYIIILEEDNVQIKESIMNKKIKAIGILMAVSSVVFSLFLCKFPIHIIISELFLKEKTYIPNVVTFSFVLIGVVFGGMFLFPFTLLGAILNNSKFSFSIDKDGVFHRSFRKTYSLRWEEINSFGIIEDVSRRFLNRSSTHTCLYFSKHTYIKESTLKKQLERVTFFDFQRSTNEMLVLEFDGTEVQDYIRKAIYPYIRMYCNSNKEYPRFADTF